MSRSSSRLSGLGSVQALLNQITKNVKSIPSEEEVETNTSLDEKTNTSVKETIVCSDTEAPLARDLQSERCRNYGDDSVEQLWGDDEDESLLLKATQISFTLDEEPVQTLNHDLNLIKCSEVQTLDFLGLESMESSNLQTAHIQSTRSCNVQTGCTQTTRSSNGQITDIHSTMSRPLVVELANLSNNKQTRPLNVLPKRFISSQSTLLSDVQQLGFPTGQYVRVLPRETSKDVIGQSKNNCFKSFDTCDVRSSVRSGECQSKRNILSRNQYFQRNIKTPKCNHLSDSKKLGMKHFVSNNECYQKVTKEVMIKDRSQSNKPNTLISKSCPSSYSGQIKQAIQTDLTKHVETEDLDKLFFQDESDLDEILKSLPEEVIMGVSNFSNSTFATFLSHGEDTPTQSKTWRSHINCISTSSKMLTDFSESSDLNPDVMSWLDEVDSSSQPSSSQPCSPDEIAKKREDAIRRRQKKQQERQLIHSRGDSVWQGRLRSPR
ncbi:uncharacterized protein LOC111084042 [Limulus polyphemus]|uniref:Uncharacterized protein LOC111084042 n=1 Tax=Limulus polyphemus TaxID=6850 RepID=A0ABM1RYS1_LIMPO|nr:uncharacterized protein LOC111084042 [Limulus polyphemus]